jgi:multisubunit Na+/H+ antiporter MnhB subunit
MKFTGLAVEALVVGLVMMALQRITGLKIFWVGVVGHLIFEVVGANRWYCTNGVACSR